MRNRPNVVLECSFEQKPYFRGSERRKLGFWEEVRFGAKIQPICSRSYKKEEDKRIGLQVQRNLR